MRLKSKLTKPALYLARCSTSKADTAPEACRHKPNQTLRRDDNEQQRAHIPAASGQRARGARRALPAAARARPARFPRAALRPEFRNSLSARAQQPGTPPAPPAPHAGRRAPRTRQQKHVTEVSRDTVSAGPRRCPRGRGVGVRGARAPRPGGAGARRGGGPGAGRAAGAPGPRGGAGRRAACYLFLLLAEPRHLRGAQRRRGRGRGRGVGPGAGRGLHGGGAGASAGRTSPKQVFVEAARPAAAQRPRARPHAPRAPR